MSTSLWSIPCIGQGGDYDDEHGDGDDDGDGDDSDIVERTPCFGRIQIMNKRRRVIPGVVKVRNKHHHRHLQYLMLLSINIDKIQFLEL